MVIEEWLEQKSSLISILHQYGCHQIKNIRVNTEKNSIIIPSSKAVDEDLSFSFNFLGMVVSLILKK